MKSLFTTLILLFYSFLTFGQQMLLEEWNKESITNKRLIPKYGYQERVKMKKMQILIL